MKNKWFYLKILAYGSILAGILGLVLSIIKPFGSDWHIILLLAYLNFFVVWLFAFGSAWIMSGDKKKKEFE